MLLIFNSIWISKPIHDGLILKHCMNKLIEKCKKMFGEIYNLNFAFKYSNMNTQIFMQEKSHHLFFVETLLTSLLTHLSSVIIPLLTYLKQRFDTYFLGKKNVYLSHVINFTQIIYFINYVLCLIKYILFWMFFITLGY